MEAEYLYHYTNIESLALILKNQKIRFNSLDRMDDLQEKETNDVKNAGQFCYISSWTSESDESIPMWNMYASLNQGVRIKMKKIPFTIYDNNVDDIKKIPNIKSVIWNFEDLKEKKNVQSFFEFNEFYNEKFFTPKYSTSDFITPNVLYEVEYTDKEEKLYPILKINEKILAFDRLGKYKNNSWSFQKEWRYIFYFYPCDWDKYSEIWFDELRNDIKSGTAKQPFPYYDMKIDDIAFSDMEITLSPRISAGNRTIVDTLVSRFNPSAKIIESALKDLI